jgi:cellulose synthase operon protein C
MPNGQETDALGDPSEPQVDVWVTDPEEAPLEPGPANEARTDATNDQAPNVPFGATPVPATDLRVPPRGAAIPDSEPLIDARDLPPLPPLPQTPSSDHLQPASAEDLARWQTVIADYEREAKAIGNEPHAASLYVEIGRVWEEQLNKPRNAAMAYQRAFHLNARDPAVLHASRRLFTEVGNWGMVVQILQAEIDGTDRPEKKSTLLAEKGTILEEKLRNVEEAQKAFRDALDIWSAEPLAINALERLHLFRREYQQLYIVYQRALSVAVKPERRMPLLIAAAQLAEDRLDDPNAALAYYGEILELDRKNGIALAALRRLTQQTERWDDFVGVMTLSAETAENPADAAQMLLSAAKVQHERMHVTDRALLLLLKALEYAPEDLTVLREIEWLYEQNQRFDEVVKVLRREAEVTTEARDRVPILFKLGTVLEDHLKLPEEAVPIFEEAVHLMPSYVPAKQALGRLYEKTARWQQLAQLFEMEVRLEEDLGVKVSKLFKLAEILDGKLGRQEEAIKSLSELLFIKPDYMPARKYLERLLQKREAWADLIALYEQEIGLTEDRDQRVFLLDRIGLMSEEKLNDPARASAAYQRILEIVPGHLHAIRTLARIATKQEQWAEVLRMHELEVEASEDQKEIVALLHRAGAITEEKLGDVTSAVRFYEKVLALSPTYLPALGSLGRLYHQQSRWEDLVHMFRKEIEVSKSAEQTVALLFRIADVLVDRVKDDLRAAKVYEEILENDRENLAALRALSEIHARSGDNERLVEVLLREATTLKDTKERASTLFKVAEICEEKLGRTDRAAEAYQEALRLGHSHDAAIRALVRIYSTEGMWNALSRALKTALEHSNDDAARAAILVRSAEVAGDKLGNLDAAAEFLEQAHTMQPTNVTVLAQLERVSVARRDWVRAIHVAEILAAHETDPRLYAARQIRIATVKETQLDPPQSGAEHYRLALGMVPDHPVALRALEIAYRRAGSWDGLAAFYQREAMVTRDPVRRVNLYCRAGDIVEHRLRRDDVALKSYVAALEVSPTHLPALRGRRRIAERAGDAATSLECIQREGELTADRERARELLFEAGQLYQDKFKNVQKAIETYEAVLARAPTHSGAFQRLEAIYAEHQAWAPLLDLLRRRAQSVDSVEEQARHYVTAGTIAQDKLGQAPLAIDLYREVLARERMNPIALVRLGPLLFAQQDWDAAIDVFHKTLAVSKEPGVLLLAFKSLGIIYQEHRQDLVKCVQSFQAAIAAAPHDTECLQRLAAVYKEAQDWSSAINVLLRLVEVDQDLAARVRTLLELAQIYEIGGHDRHNAILAHRKALELDPTNQTAIMRLSDLLEKEQDWQALTEVTAQYVRLLSPDQKDKAAPLHLKMADVYENKLRDDARAINALSHALQAEPDNVVALERLAALYSKSPDTFPHAVDMHRRLLKQDPFRIPSYHAMHQMFLRRGEHDKAFVVAEILVFLHGQQQDEELYFHEHKDKVAARAERALSQEDHERLVTHPLERGPVRLMMEVLGLELPKIFAVDLTKYDIKKEDRHGPKSDLPLRKIADEIQKTLGVGPLGAPPYELCICKRTDVGFALESSNPPALIVGVSMQRRQERDQRFQIARHLERLKSGHHIADQLPNKDLEALVFSVVRLADPNAHVPTDPASLDAMQRRVLKALSSRGKRMLEDMRAQLATLRFDATRYRGAGVLTALRAGLVITNDIEVAVRNVAKEHPEIKAVFADAKGAASTIGRIPEVRELLSYAISEEYFATRAKLGFSIQS